MKKSLIYLRTLIYLSAFVLVFAFTACSDDDDNDKATKAKVISLTKAEFLTKVANFENNLVEWSYLGKKPCIVYFSDECSSCNVMIPFLDELAVEYAGKIDIYKVDFKVETDIADAYNIKDHPTTLFCKGNSRDILRGELPKSSLKYKIDHYLLQ